MAKAMQPQKIRFSQAIQTPLYKNLVNNTLGDPVRAGRFIANITSAVADSAAYTGPCAGQAGYSPYIPAQTEP